MVGLVFSRNCLALSTVISTSAASSVLPVEVSVDSGVWYGYVARRSDVRVVPLEIE
jgi:hypothetical protein